MANGTANINVSINGNQASATYGDLLKQAVRLNRELKELTPGTEAFVRKSADLRKVRGRLNDITQGVNATRKSMINMQAVMSVFGGLTLDRLFQQFVSLGRKVIDTQAKFEKFEAVLTNALGSRSAARAALDQLQAFAAKTPFQIDELTESFVKLVNRGFQPTREQLRQIGDLAASQGKRFDQLTEAILDAQTGENERLKEFGIRAKTVGDQVRLSFKGQTVEVNKTDEAIRDAILSFGDLEGVAGSMEAVSKTLGGQLSNLADNFTGLLRTIGESGVGGAVSYLVGVMNDLVGSMVEFIKTGGKTTVAGQFMADVFGFVRDAVNQAITSFTGLANYLAGTLGPILEGAAKRTLAVYNFIAEGFNKINNFINDKLGTGRGVQLPVINFEEYRKQAKEAQRIQAEEQEKARTLAEENEKRLREEAGEKAAAAAREQARKEASARAKELEAARSKELEDIASSLLAQNEARDSASKAYMDMLEAENAAIIANLETAVMTDMEYQDRKSMIAEEARLAGMTDAQIEQEQVRMHYEHLIQEAEFYGIETVNLRQRMADEINAIAKREADFQQQMNIQKVEQFGDLSGAIADFLGADEKARKKHAEAIKAFEISAVLANLYSEIQGYFKSMSTLGPAGVVLSYTQAAAATVRAFAAVRRISSQKFAEGGFTGPGAERDSTGHRVAGVVHNDEWVAPKWMNESPSTAPVIRALENIRKRGFAEGGFTTPSTTPNAQALGSVINDEPLRKLQGTMDQLAKAVAMMPSSLKVVYQDIESAGKTLNDIRDLASL